MTADVNVTERVARELIADAARSHLAMGTEYATRLARRLLAVLSDPEVLAGMAGVLYEADPLPGKPSWDGLRSESAQWPDGVARWAETRALERASALADWLKGQG